MALNLFGKEVFHGTSSSRIKPLLEKEQDLFGIRYLGSPEISAILTDNFSYAATCALAVASIARGDVALVLRFRVPRRELIKEGNIKGQSDTIGYSTIHTVDPSSLPIQYLNHLGISRQWAIDNVASGKIVFYRVPYGYFQYVTTQIGNASER